MDNLIGQHMNILAELERDLSVCAILSKVCHRDRKFQDLPYFDSHVMELVALVDQDEEADIICIGVAFLMDPVVDGTLNLQELTQILTCCDIIYSLNNLLPEEDGEPHTHLMKVLEDDRARIVKTHDINLRLKKLDREKEKDLFDQLFHQKNILESIHVRNSPQGLAEDQSPH